MRMLRCTLVAVAVACFACSCASTRPETGLALANRLEQVSRTAHERLAAHDTTGAVRILRDAATRLGRAPDRDLVHGHLGALDGEATVLSDLAALSAATGDTLGARAAFERLVLECGYYALADSLERSPSFRALDADSAAPRWRASLRQLRRTWRDSAFVSPYRDTLSLEERVTGVSLVWAEARYSFVGLGLQGAANWDSVFAATVTRVIRPMDTWEYYQEVERMLYALDDDHTDVTQLPRPLRRHRAGLPLDARRVDGHVIVTRVGSPSLAALGVRAGQEVVAIDGLTPERHVAERVPPQLGFSTRQARDSNTFGWQLWLGDSGSTVRVRLRDPDGAEHDAALRRGGWTDATRPPIVEGRRLEGDIGYLALNSFNDPRAIPMIDSVMDALGDVRGLIVDTRLNSGGSQDAGWHVLSQFISTPFVQVEQFSSAYVGIWRAWGGLPPRVPLPERILRPDPAKHRAYPLLWLIGPRTASAAEGVAALAEQTGAATTVGERTFGSTGQPLLVPLPGGGLARVRVEEERYNDGRQYTQRGIAPQVPVRVTADGLRAGRDEVLEAALDLMRRRLAGKP